MGALTATRQPFEESLLGMPVWRLTVDGTLDSHEVAALVMAVRVEGVGLAACRLAEDDPAVTLFTAAGFRPVEALLTYEAPLAGGVAMPDGVRAATTADIADCRAIAAQGFRYDRFHADAAIDDAAADALKAQWIENAVRGRADTVLVAEAGGAVCGFNACLLAGDAAVIDLIGVHPRAQGRGIGKALVAGAMAHYGGRAKTLRAGTQDTNQASCRLYRHFGMEVVRRQVTLHWTPPQASSVRAPAQPTAQDIP